MIKTHVCISFKKRMLGQVPSGVSGGTTITIRIPITPKAIEAQINTLVASFCMAQLYTIMNKNLPWASFLKNEPVPMMFELVLRK